VREVLAPVLPGELPADGDITAWQPGLSDLLNGGVRGGAR
jgi:hypothetical protein